MAHAFLPPSGAAAWLNCALWPTMNALYPDFDKESALEGNAAHWVLSEWLNEGVLHGEGTLTPFGPVVTQEMIEGAELYRSVLTMYAPQGYAHEQFVKVDRVHPLCGGTPDSWAYAAHAYQLDIFDYKYGHKFVDEFENVQEITYTLGILQMLADYYKTGIGGIDQLIKVRFHIIQPRCYYKGEPHRIWEFEAHELRTWANRLEAAAIAALQPNPTATVNPECQYCPGRHACQALQLESYNAAQLSTQTTPLELSDAALGLELSMLKRASERLQARVEGLELSTLHRIQSGKGVPGWNIEHSKGRLDWALPDEQVIQLGVAMGKSLTKPKLVTPTQAKGLGIDESVIKMYSKNSPGKAKLAPVDQKQLRRIFT